MSAEKKPQENKIPPEKDEEFLRKIRQATGLVNLEGPLFWPQQQMLEKLSDPLAKQLVKAIQSIPQEKRTWKKILQKFNEEITAKQTPPKESNDKNERRG